MTDEWILIVFTLMGQFAAGLVILYSWFSIFKRKRAADMPAGFGLKTPEFLILLVLLVAILFSLLHLGEPKHAVYALNNIRSSWLSREILSISLVTFGVFLVFLTRWFLKTEKIILYVLISFSLLTAILLLYVMIRIYMIPTVVTWDTWYTPASFTISSLVTAVGGVMAYIIYGPAGNFRNVRFIQFFMVLLFAEALIFVAHSLAIIQLTIPHTNAFILEGRFLPLAIVRIVLILAAFSILFIITSRKVRYENPKLLKILTGLVLLLMVLEQFLGRYLFFASYVRLGL